MSISSLLVLSSVDKLESPVTLPPGRARLATKPEPTGSPTLVITMGMVVVAFFAANAGCRPCDHDQINLETNQVRRKLRQALILLLCKPVLDGDILSLNPSKLAQLLSKRLHEDRATGSSAWIQETYAEDFPCLLRVGKRNSKNKELPADQRVILLFIIFFLASCLTPFASFHLITLSARCQHLRRNRQADLLRRLEIDHQLKLRRLLDGQIGRLGSLQDFVHVICDAPVAVREVRPVGHEATGLYSFSAGVHRR